MGQNINVECFWCDPLPVAEVVFRRYHGLSHDGQRVVGEVFLSLDESSDNAFKSRDEALVRLFGAEITDDDPRWPAKCDGCGYAFTPSDGRVIFVERKFRRLDGEVFDCGNTMPVGAMSWVPLQVGITCGGDVSLATDGDGDGRCLFVVAPRSPGPSRGCHSAVVTTWRWDIDGLTAGYDRRCGTGRIGRTWKRTGTPPRITIEGNVEHCCEWFVGTISDGRLRGVVRS